jgi:hypothetical protein
VDPACGNIPEQPDTPGPPLKPATSYFPAPQGHTATAPHTCWLTWRIRSSFRH